MYFRIASYSIAAVGSVITLVALTHAGGSLRTLLSGFTIWALLPYASLAAAAGIARTRGSLLAAFITCLAVVLFGLLMYLDAVFIHVSSTGGLVFIFIPLYQLFAAAAVLIFVAVRRRYAARNI
jgi:hypothetical protein